MKALHALLKIIGERRDRGPVGGGALKGLKQLVYEALSY
jgi:hypothetical protein